MACPKNKTCVKQKGNTTLPSKNVKWCTGCDKTGKDKRVPLKGKDRKLVIDKIHKEINQWLEEQDEKHKDKEFKKRHKEITKQLRDLARFEKNWMKSFKKNKMQFD